MEMGTITKSPPIVVYTDADSGRRYSCNTDTGETSWLDDKEVGASPASASQPPPPTIKPEKKRRMSSRDLIKQHGVETKNEESQIVVPIAMATPSNVLMTSFTNGQTASLSYASNPMAPAADTADDEDLERTLYSAFWLARGICCCQGGEPITAENQAHGEDNMEADERLEKRPFKIRITDSHVIYTTRKKLLPCACCFDGCPQINTKTSLINGLNAVIAREDAGCCSFCSCRCWDMMAMYMVWLFFGCFGGHYWYKRKLFAQTTMHRLFLFFYFITAGGFGLLWLMDGFRVGSWVGGYTILFQ